MDDIDLAIKASIEALNGLAEECRTLNGKWPEFHHALVRFERDESPEIVRLAGNVAGGYEWLTPSMNIFGPLPLFVMLPSPPLFSSCHVIKGPPWLEGGREAFERLREISKRIIRRMRMIEADRIPGISSDDEVKINPLFPFIVMEWVHSCAEMNRHDSELHHESHKRIRGRDMPETTVAYTLPGGIFQAIEWALRIEVRELTTRHPVAVIEAPAPSEDEPPAPVEGPSPGPVIDYKTIIASLRMGRKPVQARLVEFMKEKREAEFLHIGNAVHDDEDISNSAIKNNVSRTNESLAELKVPLSFKCANDRVFKQESAE